MFYQIYKAKDPDFPKFFYTYNPITGTYVKGLDWKDALTLISRNPAIRARLYHRLDISTFAKLVKTTTIPATSEAEDRNNYPELFI